MQLVCMDAAKDEQLLVTMFLESLGDRWSGHTSWPVGFTDSRGPNMEGAQVLIAPKV